MSSQPEYVFPRDFHDNNRINLQHYQWVQLFGYHLNPQIPTGNPNLRIADVGTGTGIWLTDLSTRLPTTAKLEGLDISLEALPPLDLVPSNVSFRQFDIKKDIPEELIGVYDVVHIRLFVFVLLDDEVPAAVRQLAKLLKPGGYLQWGELDVTSWRIETTNPNGKTEALSRLNDLLRKHDTRLVPTWIPQLEKLLKDAGLHNVQVDKRNATGSLAFSMHECTMMIGEDLSRANSSTALSRELQQVMSDVASETRDGAWWAMTRWTVVANKPL
ncbi:S-adenosyl-L-methionine-dependent methyltransferase [Xylariaceae sp. FL1019]|nr:S-adenosyl-L-methionine-dependent methyltransferase [Xylariaceae sp. FL1019]